MEKKSKGIKQVSKKETAKVIIGARRLVDYGIVKFRQGKRFGALESERKEISLLRKIKMVTDDQNIIDLIDSRLTELEMMK